MVGKTLGHYEVLGPLGAGGMGEVYRARDSTLNREVAIKVPPEDFSEDPEFLARLEREARLLASLNQPNIAVVHDVGTEGATAAAAEATRFFQMSRSPPRSELIMQSGQVPKELC